MPNQTWNQTYYLFGQGTATSALIAALPIFTLLALLGIFRKPAWLAGLGGLAVTFLLSTFAYRMPIGTALSAATYGVGFGLFPITWIIFWAIALFRITVEAGQFEIIKDSIGRLTPDPRLQALLIAFGFGAFLEGAAGFGTPVAIAATMLVGLGFSPFRASAICLLTNTAPVAFGSIGIPLFTLAGTTGLPLAQLSAATGAIITPVALIIPLYLLLAIGGRRAVSGIWLPTLLAGAVFAAVQLAVSTYLGPQLTDILSSLTSILALVLLFQFWQAAPLAPSSTGSPLLARFTGIDPGPYADTAPQSDSPASTEAGTRTGTEAGTRPEIGLGAGVNTRTGIKVATQNVTATYPGPDTNSRSTSPDFISARLPVPRPDSTSAASQDPKPATNLNSNVASHSYSALATSSSSTSATKPNLDSASNSNSGPAIDPGSSSDSTHATNANSPYATTPNSTSATSPTPTEPHPAQPPHPLTPTYSRRAVFFAWTPYATLVACVLLWGWTPLQSAMNRLTFTIRWPFLHDLVSRMPPIVKAPTPYHAPFTVNWISAAGTACMAATLLSVLLLRIRPSHFLRILTGVLHQLRLPTLTVVTVLANAFLMNYCGATATLGLAFAATGRLFPFFSALLGWTGVFLTGSDTSSDALFGNLQVVTATRLGLSPVLMAAANSSGGVMGKMISLQTIAIAAAATGLSATDQVSLFRFTLRHSLILAALIGAIVLLYATTLHWY